MPGRKKGDVPGFRKHVPPSTSSSSSSTYKDIHTRYTFVNDKILPSRTYTSAPRSPTKPKAHTHQSMAQFFENIPDADDSSYEDDGAREEGDDEGPKKKRRRTEAVRDFSIQNGILIQVK